MTQVRWTDQAVDDLMSIRDFIERDSPQYGRLVAERLFEATSRIEIFPESGRIVPELRRNDVREIIVGEYRIVYRLKAEVATLLTVFRSSRLFPPSLRVCYSERVVRSITSDCCDHGRHPARALRLRSTCWSRSRIAIRLGGT